MTCSTVIGLVVFGQKPVSVRCTVVELTIALGRRVANVEFPVTNKVSTIVDSPGLAATVIDLRQEGVRLADLNASDEMEDVQAVIGADYQGKFVFRMTLISRVILLCSPEDIIHAALPHRMLGRSGRSSNQRVIVSCVSIGEHEVNSESISSSQEPSLEVLWELDDISINEEQHSLGEKNTMQLFLDNIQYENHRYWVSLSWKISPEALPTNYQMAIGRLNSLVKGLERAPTKLPHYDQVIQEYMKKIL